MLIANRGEIAVRIIRSARALGLRTVAVFSEADRGSPHVRSADGAVLIGPAPARDSYLRAERILDAAAATGAGAIHPGYGLLSEDAGFAAAVEAAGLCFVGPTPAQLAGFGRKDTARAWPPGRRPADRRERGARRPRTAPRPRRRGSATR